jgi:hypothetical protein
LSTGDDRRRSLTAGVETAWVADSAVGKSVRLLKTVAVLRCGVGAFLMAWPDAATNRDAGRRILVRTIGLRDLVAGAGAVSALAGGHAKAGRAWTVAGLANDAGDVALAIASRRELGTRGALTAALTPLPFVVAGLIGVVATSPGPG